jgi:hypothetical protein
MVAGRLVRNLIIAACVAILGLAALAAPAGAAAAHDTGGLSHQSSAPARAVTGRAAATASPGSQIPGPGICKKVVYPSAHYAINASGVRVAHATAATGTVTEFRIGGSLVPVTTPPSSFHAMTASDSQLRALGLPPRPGSGAARATWIREFARPGHTWYTPRWMCVGKNEAAPIIVTQPGWSGMWAQAGVGNTRAQNEYPPAGPITLAIGGMCVDDTNGSTADGNKIQVWACNGRTSQQWLMKPDGTVQVYGGKCLDVTNGGTTDGTKIQLWTCIAGDANQQWQVVNPGAALRNPHSGTCLDDTGSSTTNGTQLQIWACTGALNQQWDPPAAPPSTGVGAITAVVSSNPCVDDTNGATTAGNPIQIWACNSRINQQLTVSYDGSLQVMGNCVAVPSGSAGNGTKVVLQPCPSTPTSPGANEQWQYRPDDNAFVNLATGRCLDDTNGSTTNGTQLQIWACNSTANQVWSLPPGNLGAQGNLYNYAYASWTEPTFIPSNCPKQSAYAMWTGIGGGPGLLQNGTDLDPTNGNNPPDFWFEGLSSALATQNPETPINFPVKYGDQIGTTTIYSPAASGTPAQVSFLFDNYTNNSSATVGPVSTLYGQPVSIFYDGESAEVIAERPGIANTNPAQYYNLRQPTQGYSSFSSANIGTTQTPLEALHEDPNLQSVNMTSDGSSSGYLISQVQNWTPDPTGNTNDSWQSVWQNCQ